MINGLAYFLDVTWYMFIGYFQPVNLWHPCL